MNKYQEYFENEWKYLEKLMKGKIDLEVYGEFKNKIKEMLDIWSKQDHSGFSANFFAPKIAHILENAMLYKPFTPIQEDEVEWQETFLGKYQSKRLPSLFKEKEGNAYYLDAIIWKEESGATFTGVISGITSRQYVKFPFTPREFIIKVKETENGYEIVDEHTLYQALCYYKPFTKEAEEFVKKYEERDGRNGK